MLLPGTKDGVSLKRLFKELGSRKVTSVMIEGGATIAAALLRARLVDKLSVFYAPKLIGGDGLPMIASLNVKGLSSALLLSNLKARRVGEDFLLEGLVK